METLPQLPESQTTHIYNPAKRKYEVLCLKTGRLLEEVDQNTSPTVYSTQIADSICDRIRAGETLQSICRDPNMPSVTRIYHWMSIHPDLRIRYEQARLQRADAFHDKAIELGLSMPSKDDVPATKLAVDTLKWAAEKASPNYYGSKKEEDVIHKPTIIVLNTGIDREGAPSIEELLRKKEPVTIEAEVSDAT